MRRSPFIVLLVCIACRAAAAQTAPSLFADRSYNAGVGKIADVAFSPDGRLLAVVGSGGGLAVWDTQSASLVRQVAISSDPSARVAFGGPGTVAVGTDKGIVSTVSLLTGQVHEVTRHARAVTALAMSPDGTIGASGDANGDIALWPGDGGGQAEKLREDTRRAPIVFLAFASPATMVSITKELAVSTWDVPKRRSVRRGTLQLEVLGRSADYSSASVEPSGAQLALASQYLAQPRGGLLAGGGMARPEDLKRTNVIVPYGVDSGVAGDAIQLGDFLPDHIALSPGACFALFTSSYRDQPRLHVWSLVKQGQDVVRLEVPGRPSAIALDPTGRYVAIGFATGDVRTWRVSGATLADCAMYRNAQLPAAAKAGPRVALGPDAQPLFPQGAGFKVAVLKFDASGLNGVLGDAVAEMVGGELSNSSSVVVIERAAIDAIVKEMQLQSSGLTAADAARVGRGLNAQKVVLGSVRRFGESTYVISARVVDVETQQVQGNREVTCENCTEADLPAAVLALRRVIVP